MKKFKVYLLPVDPEKYNFSEEVYYTKARTHKQACYNVAKNNPSVAFCTKYDKGYLKACIDKPTSQEIIDEFLKMNYEDILNHERKNIII